MQSNAGCRSKSWVFSSLQYYYYVQKAVRNVCKYLEKRYEEKNTKYKFHMPKKTVAPMSNDDQPDVDMSTELDTTTAA